MIKSAAVILCLLLSTPPSWAQPAATGGPAILRPADGATVSSPVTIVISGLPGAHDMAGAHAHLHLVIDSPLPPPGTMVPMDARHLHLQHGETRKTLPLPAGTHTAQLVEGTASHVIEAGAPHSALVTFTVK